MRPTKPQKRDGERWRELKQNVFDRDFVPRVVLGRAPKGKRPAVRAHIMRRAKALGVHGVTAE